MMPLGGRLLKEEESTPAALPVEGWAFSRLRYKFGMSFSSSAGY